MDEYGDKQPRALLDAVAPLPVRPMRVLVAGTAGAGKRPLRVAALLDIPQIEIDALFHGPGWTPQDTFESEVHSFSAGSCWVTEWQYSGPRDSRAAR